MMHGGFMAQQYPQPQYPQQPADSPQPHPQQYPQPQPQMPHYGPQQQMPNGPAPQQYPQPPANPPYPQQYPQHPQPPAPAPYPQQYPPPSAPGPYPRQPAGPYQQPYAPAPGAPQPYPPAPHYPQAPQFPPQQPHQYPNPPMPAPPQPQPQPQQYQNPPMPAPPQMQAQMQQYQHPPMPAPPRMMHAQAPYMPPEQAGPAVGFPPPMNWTPPRDALVSGAAPFLESGEQVYYGFPLKLDDTIEQTPRELMIAIEGQHHTLGEINRAQRKINRGMKWAFNPMDAASEMIAEKSVEALNKKLAGPVFLGGWESQAGLFIRFSRATREDYGPGAWGVITSHRYIIFRAGRMGGAAMRMVYAVPRTAIAGVRLEGTKDAMLHGRTPRAELHFTDGSMVATMMATRQGEQLAAILQVQQQQNGRQGY